MEEVREELNRRTCYDANRPLLWCSFGLFMFFLLWIILLKACQYVALWQAHIMPSFTIQERFMWQFERPWPTGKSGIRDIFLNVEIFLPFGIYLPLLAKRRYFVKGALISIAVITMLETIQLLDALGGMHFNDFIFNMLGYMLGYLIFKLIIERWCTAKVVNVINIGIIVVTTPIMIWAVIYTLIHIEWYFMFYSGTLVAP